MNVPGWYESFLLSLAAWRLFQLLAADDVLDRPRRYVTRLDPRWVKEGDPTGSEYRVWLGSFLTCPYCFGFWVALGWWGAWLIWPYETLVAAVPFTISAGVIGAARILSSE